MRSAELAGLRSDVALGPLTTLGVGGRAQWFAAPRTAAEIQTCHRWAADRACPLLVLGGGSNVVLADEGWPGLVMQIDVRGYAAQDVDGELRIEAGAGEAWDGVVARVVDAGFAGVECLSGIPGSVGGTPIQNVGAYGQDVSQTIKSVSAMDRVTGDLLNIAAGDCGFSYRSSRFKTRDAGRFIITAVVFHLRETHPTTTYPDVVNAMQRAGIDRPTPGDVRRAVLGIRRRKGMVLDAADLDTRSVGSFFVNPVLTPNAFDALRRLEAAQGEIPFFPMRDGSCKVPAAWLIERAGLAKGHMAGRTGLSSKHPLAIVNRGGATAREIIEFAADVKRRVIDRFGVPLVPEPVFVGFESDPTVAFLQKANL